MEDYLEDMYSLYFLKMCVCEESDRVEGENCQINVRFT